MMAATGTPASMTTKRPCATITNVWATAGMSQATAGVSHVTAGTAGRGFAAGAQA